MLKHQIAAFQTLSPQANSFLWDIVQSQSTHGPPPSHVPLGLFKRTMTSIVFHFQLGLPWGHYQIDILSHVWLFLAPDAHHFYQSGYDMLQ